MMTNIKTDTELCEAFSRWQDASDEYRRYCSLERAAFERARESLGPVTTETGMFVTDHGARFVTLRSHPTVHPVPTMDGDAVALAWYGAVEDAAAAFYTDGQRREEQAAARRMDKLAEAIQNYPARSPRALQVKAAFAAEGIEDDDEPAAEVLRALSADLTAIAG